MNDQQDNVKLPYNLRIRQEKNAEYRNLIRPELADQLYDKIMLIMVMQKKYRDKTYTAKVLAKELNTNTRYLSAVINSRFGMNFSRFVNECRIKEAKYLLVDRRYEEYTIEDISEMVGFANRQSFYASFYSIQGMTPNMYRKQHMNSSK